jgi:transposase
MTPHSKDKRYSYTLLGNSYIDVNQHWIVVHSIPAKERAKKSISRKFDKLVFILASNDLDIGTEEIIDAYKNQFVIERDFHFIKSPKFLADSLYLKKTERIEALLFIMTLSLCLMVYISLEMKIRTSLKDNDEFFIN